MMPIREMDQRSQDAQNPVKPIAQRPLPQKSPHPLRIIVCSLGEIASNPASAAAAFSLNRRHEV
jgi:hypothetical protein